VNPDPVEEPISLEDVGLDGPQVRRRRGRAVKTFSQWIKNEPKEKLFLLFDEGGSRHGIKTTNFAESYNFVLRGSRHLPLVGIIEFFMYHTMLYFHTRRQKADKVMRNYKESNARSLRGGGGELGNLKTLTLVSLFLHKHKLEHTI
jgi:hypothetical protein